MRLKAEPDLRTEHPFVTPLSTPLQPPRGHCKGSARLVKIIKKKTRSPVKKENKEPRADVYMPCPAAPALDLALQDDAGVLQLCDAPDSRDAAQVGQLRRDVGAVVEAAGCSAARLC